ncbi:hypothetical protein [Photobacterium kishitanii]|uniref:hypothetical protein n=1 Tax=Photobacterium kishitanii TaxID=318456 RepID=UPI00071AEF7B|nr:hypothetical protein [Photobacterium kishitanii]
MLNKALIGIVSALVFLIIQAIISSVNTKATYEFSINNNIAQKETLKLTLNDGHASMLISRNSNNQDFSHFDGLFLRFQNHYYLFGIEHIDNNNSQFKFSSLFIDSLRSGEAIYIPRSPSLCLDKDFPGLLLGKKTSG